MSVRTKNRTRDEEGPSQHQNQMSYELDQIVHDPNDEYSYATVDRGQYDGHNGRLYDIAGTETGTQADTRADTYAVVDKGGQQRPHQEEDVVLAENDEYVTSLDTGNGCGTVNQEVVLAENDTYMS